MLEITFAEIFEQLGLIIIDILKFATILGGGVIAFGLLALVVIFFAVILAPFMD